MSFKCFFNSHFVFVSQIHISFLQGSSFRFAVIIPELMTAVVRRILRAEVILARALAGRLTRITAEHRRAAELARVLAVELTAEQTAAATT